MKTVLVIFSALFGAWFWQKPVSSAPERSWPAGMPVFAATATVSFASSLRNGTGFVSLLVAAPADQVLADAGRAYAEAGWVETGVRARDTRFFVRGAALAAVLVQETPRGTRVTAIQRPRGL